MTRRDAQSAERFREAFKALPQGPREVFWAHSVEGLDYAAIAERMGIGVAEVKAQLAEAIQQIERGLREVDPPGSG